MKKRFLRDIAEIQTGPFGSQLHKEDYVDVGTPIVTVEHLGSRVFSEQNLPMVSDADKSRLSKYVLKKGDIVFSRVGSVDRCSFVDQKHDGWMFSGRCLRVRPSEEVEPLFLYYFFCLNATKEFVRSIAVGATMPSINTKLLGEVEVVCPGIEEQRKIADILSKIDDKIEENQKINENLQQQAQALFTQCYEQADVSVPFTDLIQVLGGGTPKTGEASYWNGEIPFFTPKDVATPYTLTTEKTITQSGLEHCNSRLYPVNTVFVTARGTVGKVGLAGVPMAMNQSCYALTGKSISPLLTYHYTLMTVAHLKHKASGAVFDAIITRDFETETVKKLSDTLAEQFVAVASPIYECILNNTLESQRLADLRNALLPKLMSGELDASDIEL